jgi:methylenetetrahydrofolate dehydrogenase (NADP+)/methenyltetrahydrofolate cyclohydrolase
MPATLINADDVAAVARAALRAEIAALPEPLRLLGLISGDHAPAHTYAQYTRKACDGLGVEFEIRQVARLDMEAAVQNANADPRVHGIMIYYPVFGTQQDTYLRDLVAPEKDIEGLHSYWARCLYDNRRFYGAANEKKCILPCTPLAIVKLLEQAGLFGANTERPLDGRRACIFNRSEVVGRPLAAMLANDGAEVVSFDIDGAQLFLPGAIEQAHSVAETTVDRRQALASADIVIGGVPTRAFERIAPSEVRSGSVCLNFSTVANFRPDIVEKDVTFIPRVGPMTITMALRNALRLYRDSRG